MISIGQKWRHKKRGTTYEIVHDNSLIQCATDPAVEAYEGYSWIAYKPERGPFLLFFRLRDEFLDGRFELVESP